MENQFDDLKWIENIRTENLRPFEIFLLIALVILIQLPKLLEALNARTSILCRDGTRSNARGRQGACSWHGGASRST